MTAGFPKDDIVISDATVLINFLETGHFDFLLTLYGGKLHITDAVLAEIKRNTSPLRQAITDHKIAVDPISLEEIDHARKTWAFQAGEASCYQLAKRRSWKVATDDRAAKNAIEKDLGPAYIVTTFDILVVGVELSVISKSDALRILGEMESAAYFQYGPEDFKKFQDNLRRF